MTPKNPDDAKRFAAMIDAKDLDGLEPFAKPTAWDRTKFDAIAELFADDPRRAFDRLAFLFAVSHATAAVLSHRTLALLSPVLFKGGKPFWAGPRANAPEWLHSDPRWFDLCARLRRHPKLGDVARSVLRHHDRTLASRALEAVMAAEAPLPAPRTTRVGGLVDRYVNGEHIAVWNELRALGPVDGDMRLEALDVARLTMDRASHNADTLAQRLENEGWRALGGKLRTKPTEEDARTMKAIAEASGAPLPVSLLAFWERVGAINFVWDYNSKDKPPSFNVGEPVFEMDPLNVDGPALADDIEEWEYQSEESFHPELRDPFFLALAPDELHKLNVSGGPPYGIELPTHVVDPIFDNEYLRETFVDYLRRCFRCAGFPTLSKYVDTPGVQAFLAKMREGLVEL